MEEFLWLRWKMGAGFTKDCKLEEGVKDLDTCDSTTPDSACERVRAHAAPAEPAWSASSRMGPFSSRERKDLAD